MYRIMTVVLVIILATAFTSLAVAGSNSFSANGKVGGLSYRAWCAWESPNAPMHLVGEAPMRSQFLYVRLEGKGAKQAIAHLFDNTVINTGSMSKDGSTYGLEIFSTYEVMVPATPCPMSTAKAAEALSLILGVIEDMRANELGK